MNIDETYGKFLKDGERLDDLEYDNLRLIQRPDGYCFTSDSVLLSNLARVKKGDRVADIGTGSGVVAILIAAKFLPETVVGVEIQERLADMAARSVALNGLTERVKIVCAPAQGVEKLIGDGYDVVVSNPPYEPAYNVAEPSEKDICRSEIKLTAEECVSCASRLLKYGGLFYTVNRARRLIDVVCAMRRENIEPKKLILIQPKRGKKIDTFIVEGKKGGNPSLDLPEPVVIYEEDGGYTEFARRLYNK